MNISEKRKLMNYLKGRERSAKISDENIFQNIENKGLAACFANPELLGLSADGAKEFKKQIELCKELKGLSNEEQGTMR